MARLARIVIPGTPHHITQRGNGRQQTFFTDDDYAFYRRLLGERCAAAGVAVWSWVLMPNHVHLILVPSDADGIRRALAPLHRTYAGHATPGCGARAIFGRAASVAWRWMRSISPPPCAMWR